MTRHACNKTNKSSNINEEGGHLGTRGVHWWCGQWSDVGCRRNSGIRDLLDESEALRSERPKGSLEGNRRLGPMGVTGAYVGATRSRDHNAQMLNELELKKDFEVAKENITSLEMRKPTFVHRGHVVISTTGGNQVNIILPDGGD